jgi:hypothetical protein
MISNDPATCTASFPAQSHWPLARRAQQEHSALADVKGRLSPPEAKRTIARSQSASFAQ